MTMVSSRGGGPPRLSRRTMVLSLALAAVGSAAVSCVGRGAVAVPASGGAAAAIPAAQPAANAVALDRSAPANAAAAVPTQPPTTSGAPATAVAQPVATVTDKAPPTSTAAASATTEGTAPTASRVPEAPKQPAATTVPAPAAPRPATTAVVEMNDQFKFSPSSLTIAKGSTVVWKNVGAQPHTVTFDPSKAMNKADVALPGGVQPFDSGYLVGGQSYSHTFTVAGTYRYICIPHEMMGMLGTIIVQ